MQSAKIVASSGLSVETRNVDGLFTCLLKHEVKATAAEFEYTGPAMPKEMWQEVLAFFKWTYDTEKSEAQVRLFVHPQEGWLAWAFPQKGGTGMTIKELGDDEEFKKQRAEKIPDGYYAWGTVHHHCGTSAFQSGTDEADEKLVEGLHITVGKVDKERHDIHCRMYFKGHKFEPNMSHFWDVGDGILAKAKECEEILGVIADLDKIARWQMCEPAPKDHPFNATWKENYRLEPKVVYSVNGLPWDRETGKLGAFSNRNVYCHYCGKMTDHAFATCPVREEAQFGGTNKTGMAIEQIKMSKKECKKQKRELANRTPAQVLADIIEVAKGKNFVQEEVIDAIDQMFLSQDGELIEIIFRELADTPVEIGELAAATLEAIDATESQKEDQTLAGPTTPPWVHEGYGEY